MRRPIQTSVVLWLAFFVVTNAGCEQRNERVDPGQAVAGPAPRRQPDPSPTLQPWSDDWLVAQAPLYLDDPGFRRKALEASLTSHDNIYARTRLGSYGLQSEGWDMLPQWVPRQRVVDAQLVDSLRRGEQLELAGMKPIWDGVHPTDYAGWVALGRVVFHRYPLRPEIFARYALVHPKVAANVGLREAEDGTWPGVVAFADIDGSAQIGITCALCHVGFEGQTAVVGQARRDLDYGRMRLTYHEQTGVPLPPELAHRMGSWGPGRADITQDDDEDPVAIVDLWHLRNNRFLTQAATLTHGHPAALAIRQETQILHTNLERTRPPRELAWALAMFLYSIEPPRSQAAVVSARAERGRVQFERRCRRCHSDANGGGAPVDAEVVGTDARLAFGGARGTGLYRPSPLVRVADAAPYFHDGTLGTLEDLLGEARLRPDYEHVGGVGAVVGHRYGTTLAHGERADLIDYLKTL